VAAFEYAPYGGLTVVDADEMASTPTGVLPPSMAEPSSLCPMLFSTKYYDHEVGLYYYGYRYYRPETGTWLNRDPLAEQGGLNLYAMVGNDPMNAVDPLGLADLNWHHNIPQKLLDDGIADMLADGVTIHDAEFGQIMKATDHQKLHSGKYVDHWRDWLKAQKRGGGKITKKQLLGEIRKLRSSDEFGAVMKRGFGTKLSYNQWRRFSANTVLRKLKAAKAKTFLTDLGKLPYDELVAKYKKRAAKRAGRKSLKAAGKQTPILNCALIGVAVIMRVMEGESVAAAAGKECGEALPVGGPAVMFGNCINDLILEDARAAAEAEQDRIVRFTHGVGFKLPDALKVNGLMYPPEGASYNAYWQEQMAKWVQHIRRINGAGDRITDFYLSHFAEMEKITVRACYTQLKTEFDELEAFQRPVGAPRSFPTFDTIWQSYQATMEPPAPAE
jgi:RHS repeat-associated protein